MSYEPAHDCYVGYAIEQGTVTESPDGTAPPTPPALPESFVIIGYLKNTPEFARGLNNSWGYAVGSRKGAYRKRGARNPTMSMSLSVTDKGICQKAIIAPGETELPRLCFVMGRPGLWTIAIRDAKINTMGLSCRESPSGEASEVEAQLQIMACYTQPFAVPLNLNPALLLRALGDPFYWHDCRKFDVTDYEGEQTDYRQGLLMNWSANLNNNLERKGERQNFGDNHPLSNTNYFLLEHNEQPTGEIGLHGRLPAQYFNAAAQAQDWGDIVLGLSNAPGLDDPADGKGFTLTLEDCFPTNYTEAGVDSNAQRTSTIPYAARGMSIT